MTDTAPQRRPRQVRRLPFADRRIAVQRFRDSQVAIELSLPGGETTEVRGKVITVAVADHGTTHDFVIVDVHGSAYLPMAYSLARIVSMRTIPAAELRAERVRVADELRAARHRRDADRELLPEDSRYDEEIAALRRRLTALDKALGDW